MSENLNKLKDRLEDRLYAYRGEHSKNSIIGNKIRHIANELIYKGTNKVMKKMTDDQIREAVKKHVPNATYRSSHSKDEAMMVPKLLNKDGKETHNLDNIKSVGAEIVLGDNTKNKRTLYHELGHGHHIQKKGNNHARYVNRAIGKEKIIHPEGSFEARKENAHNQIRLEQEANVQAKKFHKADDPKYKEGLVEGIHRRAAMGTYERDNEFKLQSQKFKEDKDYRKKMLLRTGKKVGGAAVGGVAGNLIAKKALSKLRNRRSYLKGKAKKTPQEILELSKLNRKFNLIVGGATAVGAIGGYKVAKKYS